MNDVISRRSFLKAGLAVGAGCCGLAFLKSIKPERRLKELKAHSLKKGVVVSQISETAMAGIKDPVSGKPDDAGLIVEEAVINDAVRRGVKALGGMDKMVSYGDKVVIKPNIAWNRGPEFAANTNPFVVAALTKLCLESGASKVTVIDHTCSTNPGPSYANSRIAHYAGKAGANVRFVDKQLFTPTQIPGAKSLKSWPFYDGFIFADEVDVLINAPIAKHHSTSRLSMALKNAFGMIGGDRGLLHKGIHENIADLNRIVKADLTVLDAFRTLRDHGPTGGRLEDVDNSAETARKIIIGTDPVAIDAYGSTLFGLSGSDIGFVRESYAAGLGEMDFRLNGFETVVV